jgi:flagellar hook-associated protein 1 FlgK
MAGMDKARMEQLQRLEEVFPPGEQGIGYAAGNFLNAMVDLASNPQDLSARQVVLSRADEMASRFSNAQSQLDSLQRGVTHDLKTTVDTVNGITQNIANVNQEIARAKGLGHAPNELLDQRDQLITELSKHLQVSTVPADDGTLGVFVAGGQRLVLSNQATQLAIVPDQLDSSRSSLGIVEAGGGTRAMPSDMLTGGSIAGLLRFQNEDLVNAGTSLGQMAAAIATRVNEQQGLGLDLRNPAGAGAAIFSTGAAQALPASTNARDGVGNFIGGVSLTVADASLLEASEYDLRSDPNNVGQYLLTRRSDGLERSINSGDTVDGVTITIGVPAPAPTDKFLLQPVSRAASGMQRVLDDPRGVAAASPVAATVGVANTGTATIGALAVVSTSVNPQNTANIAFTSAGGDYAWELRDRDSNALVSSGTGTWTAGEPIALNGFELSLSGVPANGDSFSVGKTMFPASNNGNALALAGLRDEKMVGREMDSGGQIAGGRSITDAYASVMAGVGVSVQRAESASGISASVALAAASEKSSKTGVNLDEEAANLIQYQQAYQAAAKVLQVAQSVFDTLLKTAGA